MFKNRIFISGLLFVVASLLQSCSQASNNKPDTEAVAQDLYAQIQQTLQTEGCVRNSDCDLLPVGSKPCGGPESYQPYSKTSSDVAKLQELGNRYQKLRDQYNKENQIMGICVITPKPNVSCVRNQCVTSEKATHVQ
ncbi:hypothetical protein [Kangiella sediminilitoris]|uniref:Lipoprotein n=1 Tax=Kangiella sediminilitoris TaxID=1144748 RepID=A0A1B3B8R2_9GAMM|nr:hypothetical protein [Kangiella sediminilitoris]AOE49187.1 hypothetical protein KS2013_463 [Kangiella sediminilitoris]